MNINWNAKTVKLSELKPYGRNPRRISEAAFKKLKESIQQDGYHQRIVANTDLTVVGGHQRLKALKELGIKEVEVLVPTEQIPHEDFRRILVRDNLPFGEFDMDMLGNDFEVDELVEWGMPESWLPEIEDAENIPNGDEDEAGTTPEAPLSVLGDVYEIGHNRLVCGDSTQINDYEKLMGDKKADQIITDPPYNVSYEGKTKDALTIQNDEMGDDAFLTFLTDCFVACNSYLKSGGVFYIWHADIEGFNFRGACKAAGWQVRQCLIWKKQTLVMGRQDYHWKHEPCLYGWKDGAGHLWSSDRKQTTILEFDRPQRNAEHPTMKPIALIEYQILNNTKGEDIVLDVFGGSGSTMVAAHKHNRICYMMELDPKYCDVIVSRMVKLYPDLDIKRNGEKIEWEGTDNG